MTLKVAVASMEEARNRYFACCLDVWREVEQSEPALAAAMRELGFGDEQAAEWLCTDPGSGSTPAELVVAGRSSELVDRIRQTLHGWRLMCRNLASSVG